MMAIARDLASRPRLVLATLVLLAVNQLRIAVETWGQFTLRHPGFADFGSYYVYARVGLHQGWDHLYDLAAQRQEWLAVGGPHVVPWFPIIYPPPLAWIVVPFTVLPLPIAFGAWFLLSLGCALVSWRLVAPRRPRLARWSALAAMLAVFAVPYALILGQVLVIELAAIAVAWRFLKSDRQVSAGLVLTALVFKPQVAVLVPIVLLLIGRRRTVAVWFTGSTVIAGLAIVTTGWSGLHDYAIRVLGAAAVQPQFLVPAQFTITGLLGHGPQAPVAVGLLVALTLAAAFRHREAGLALPLACALVGSMLITPYLHSQDLATLLLAGAIACHGPIDRWRRWLLLAGYGLLLAISYWGFGAFGPLLGGLLLLSETLWLLSAALWPMSGSAARPLPALVDVPLDRTA